MRECYVQLPIHACSIEIQNIKPPAPRITFERIEIAFDVIERTHRRHLFGAGDENGDTQFAAEVGARAQTLGEVEHEARARSVVNRTRRFVAHVEKQEGDAAEDRQEADEG